MPQFSKAGFWNRLAAVAVDWLVILYSYIIIFTFFFWFGYSHISSNQFITISISLFLPITCAAFLIYYSLTACNERQSLGKKLFQLHIVDSNEQKISPVTSLKRSAMFLISILFFGIGHFYMLFSKEKLTLYDKISKTFVIKDGDAKINFKDVVTVFACFVLFMFLANIYFGKHIQTFQVESDNMAPTILPGDRLLVDVYWPEANTPNPGDLLLIEDGETGEQSIFRCVAIEEQIMEVRGGTIFVDNQMEFRSISVDETFDFDPETVPEGHCFVLNDSFSSNTEDSRTFGFVPLESIKARAGVIYYSTNEFVPFYNPFKKINWNRLGKTL